MKCVLITGVSGFLGQHLLHHLLEEKSPDLEIHGIYQKEDFEARVRKHHSQDDCKRLFLHRVDLLDEESLKGILKDKVFDVCFHLAALSSPAKCQQDPEKAAALNVPRSFFRTIRSTPVVALSTDQVYNGQDPALYVETSTTDPVNVYGETKVAMEEELLVRHPSPTMILRSSIILGPRAPFGGAHDTFIHFCQSRASQPTTFYTDEIRSVVSVFDVVASLVTLGRIKDQWQEGMRGNNGSVYNMGGPDPVSRYDMAVATAHGADYSLDAIESATKVDQGEPSVPSPLNISMNSLALETLVGFKFRGLQRIVRETLERNDESKIN